MFGFRVSGGINLQLAAGVPASTITVVQSVLIIVIAGAAWWTTTTRPATITRVREEGGRTDTEREASAQATNVGVDQA